MRDKASGSGGRRYHLLKKLGCAALLAFTLAPAGPGVRAVVAADTVRFAEDGALTVTPGEAAEADILNDSGDSVVLELRVSVRGADGALTVEPASLTIPPAGEGTVTVTVDPDQGADDLHGRTGWLVATGEAVIVRRPLTVHRPALEPVATTWEATVVLQHPRPSWRDPYVRPSDLPLASQDCHPDDPEVEGWLMSAADRVAVRIKCPVGDRLVMRFPAGTPRPGEYSGVVTVGDTDVEVSLLVTRHLWMAVVALLAGLGLSWWLHHWVRQRKQMNELLRVHALTDDVVSAHRWELPDSPGWAVYSWEQSGRAEVDRLLQRVQAAQGDAATLKEIEEDAGALRSLAASWKALPGQLRDLEDRHRDLGAGPGGEPPNLFGGRLAKLLDGQWRPEGEAHPNTLSLPGVREVVALVTAGRPGLDMYRALDEALHLLTDRDLRSTIASLGDADLTEENGKLDGDVRTALERLRSGGEHPATLTTQNRRDEASDLRARARAHADTVKNRRTPAEERGPMTLRLARPERPRVPAVDGQPPAVAVDTTVTLRRKLKFGDARAMLIAMAIAVVSGLGVVYVGKPWGTAMDFLLAIAWGYGATTLLTPGLTALERLVTRPFAPQG